MVKLRKEAERVLSALLKDLPTKDLREAVDFISFLRTRSRIDPSQAYFWTTRWQTMEQRVEQDKRRRRVIGSGPVDSLLRALKA